MGWGVATWATTGPIISTVSVWPGDSLVSAPSRCRHDATACVQVGRRHCEDVCLECGDSLARYRFEPDPPPVVLRDPPPAADVPRAPTVHRSAVQRWHRASPRRFQGAAA